MSTSHGLMKALKCRECGATTDLDASYACMECFGPLEVAYERTPVTREQIESGPVSMWRYEALLPVVPGAHARPGLQPGFTRLVRADNLARELGARLVWVKDDSFCLSTGNPDFPFRVIEKERIVCGWQMPNTAPRIPTYTVKSKGKTYLVTGGKCNCTGYSYRRHCTHVEAVASYQKDRVA